MPLHTGSAPSGGRMRRHQTKEEDVQEKFETYEERAKAVGYAPVLEEAFDKTLLGLIIPEEGRLVAVGFENEMSLVEHALEIRENDPQRIWEKEGASTPQTA